MSFFEWANNSGILEAALWGLAGVIAIVALQNIPTLIAVASKFVLTTIPKVLSALSSWIVANWGLVASFGAIAAAAYIFSQWDSFSQKTKTIITAIAGLITVVSAAAIAWLTFQGLIRFFKIIGIFANLLERQLMIWQKKQQIF